MYIYLLFIFSMLPKQEAYNTMCHISNWGQIKYIAVERNKRNLFNQNLAQIFQREIENVNSARFFFKYNKILNGSDSYSSTLTKGDTISWVKSQGGLLWSECVAKEGNIIFLSKSGLNYNYMQQWGYLAVIYLAAPVHLFIQLKVSRLVMVLLEGNNSTLLSSLMRKMLWN